MATLYNPKLLGQPISMPTRPLVTTLYNPKLLGRQPSQPKLQLNTKLGDVLHLNIDPLLCQPADKAGSPPRSPVKTDLALGRPKVKETTLEKTQPEQVKDFLGCISSERPNRLHELQSDKPVGAVDIDSFKKLLKGLLEKVWWQQEAASAVATTVTQCKIGNGKSRGGGSKGDKWLLFTGPDRVGKKKMASALSEQLCGSNTITISLGSRRNDGESDLSFRGKTALDRIVEAVRRNPCSVIMLEDVDEADMLLRGNIKRAMERGRLADSHGREITLGNVIFILTTDWLPDNLKFLSNGISLDEEKLVQLARSRWQLKLSLCEKTMKRRANWLNNDDRATKKNTSSALSFDLNEAADVEGEKADGSRNSSDLTNDHEDDHALDNRRSSTNSSAPREMLNSADETIVFKPVDFGPIRRDITNSITKKFSTVIKDRFTLELHDEALEKILSGVWLGRTGLEEWMEKVLVSSFHKLKSHLPSTTNTVSGDSIVVRLEPDGNSDGRSDGDWLPSSIKVVADGL